MHAYNITFQTLTSQRFSEWQNYIRYNKILIRWNINDKYVQVKNQNSTNLQHLHQIEVGNVSVYMNLVVISE